MEPVRAEWTDSVGAYVMGTHVLIENEKCQVVTPLIQRVVSRVLDT